MDDKQQGMFALSIEELQEYIDANAEVYTESAESKKSNVKQINDIVNLVAETDGLCLIMHTHDTEKLGKGFFEFIPNVNTKLLLDISSKPSFVTFAHKLILDSTLESLLIGSIMQPITEEAKKTITHGKYAVLLDDNRIVNAVACVVMEYDYSLCQDVPIFIHWELDKRDLTDFDNDLNICVVGFSKKYDPIPEDYDISNSIYVR